MGTNYYAVKNGPTTREPIHIGKSSLGHRFLFQYQNKRWNDPPVVWKSYPGVIAWLEQHSPEYVIIDEYDRIVTLKEFKDLIAAKQTIPLESEDVDLVDGYRFEQEEFS